MRSLLRFSRIESVPYPKPGPGKRSKRLVNWSQNSTGLASENLEGSSIFLWE